MKSKSHLYNREGQVRAMKELLQHYKAMKEYKSVILGYCPLCDAVEANCSRCIWLREKGMKCVYAAKKARYHYAVADLRFKRDYPFAIEGKIPFRREQDRWINRRIRELTSWIRKYDSHE